MGALLILASCSKAPAKTDAASAQQSTSSKLGDRSYACDAFNVTRSSGPYSATCEKTGRTVHVTFTGREPLVLSVDEEVSDDGFTWDIHATDGATRDDWNLTVEDR